MKEFVEFLLLLLRHVLPSLLKELPVPLLCCFGNRDIEFDQSASGKPKPTE